MDTLGANGTQLVMELVPFPSTFIGSTILYKNTSCPISSPRRLEILLTRDGRLGSQDPYDKGLDFSYGSGKCPGGSRRSSTSDEFRFPMVVPTIRKSTHFHC